MSRADTARRGERTRAGKGTTARPTAEALPAWVAPVVYALMTMILFREAVFAGASLLGTDSYALSYFARSFYTDFVQELHRFPLWDPLLFGGLPFVEGMHGDIFYPPSLALFFLDARAMWPVKMMLHVFLAGVFAYMFARGLGLGRPAALFCGLVYMLGGHTVSLVYPGGDGKLFGATLAPLVFWLADRAARTRRIADFALFALGIALVVFTSHMQMAYFIVWGVSLFFFFRLYQQWKAEHSGGAVARMLGLYTLAGILGVAAAAAQFLPPLDYLRDWSHRADRTLQAEAESAYAYSTTYSLHWEEIASLVVPEFIGDNIAREQEPRNTYWGRNAFKINHDYAGLVPLLLGLLAFVRRRTAETWFFAVLAVLALLYALGANTPAFRLFYLIPGVNLFRAPSLIIFLYALSVSVLGAMGLERLLEWLRAGSPEDAKSARRVLWSAAGVLAVLALLASGGILMSIWQGIFEVTPAQQQALAANTENITIGFWIAFAIAAIVAAVWEGGARGVLSPRTAFVVLAVVAAHDLYRMGRPFVEGTLLYGEFAADPALFQPDETIAFLQQQQETEVFRVFDLGILGGSPAYGTNVLATHGLAQVAGHHGNEIGRYRELVGGDSAFNIGLSGLALLDILNARYLVSNQLYDMGEGYTEVFRGSRAVVYRNDDALPRAFLVGAVEVVPDERAVAVLIDSTFDARTRALLPEPLPADIEIQPDPQGTVAWEERGVNAFALRVTTDRPALLVLTDNYFPAWHVTVDDEPVPVLRANYTFRAVPVPAGTHTVRFAYRSEILRASAAVSVIVLLGLGATAVAGILGRPKERAA